MNCERVVIGRAKEWTGYTPKRAYWHSNVEICIYLGSQRWLLCAEHQRNVTRVHVSRLIPPSLGIGVLDLDKALSARGLNGLGNSLADAALHAPLAEPVMREPSHKRDGARLSELRGRESDDGRDGLGSFVMMVRMRMVRFLVIALVEVVRVTSDQLIVFGLLVEVALM